jgi:hypothetical protein
MEKNQNSTIPENYSETVVRKNCRYCNGYGFVKTLGTKATMRECPVCGGGNFHKMIDSEFDLKK